ncbi:MAG: preprotein translocase subunit SecG [Bacteroidales bacterium]
MGLFVLLTVLVLIVAVLIVLVVLVQNSKGGGLASNFAGSNQYMGVRRTADFLEKATWTLAIAMLVFVLASSKVIPKYEAADIQTDTEIRRAIDDIPVDPAPFNPEAATQQAPVEQPAEEGGDSPQ